MTVERLVKVLNVFARWYILGPLIFWGLYDIFVLIFRHKLPGLRTISGEAMSIAFRGLTSLAYVWGGMLTHWFVPWRRLPIPERWAGYAAGLWWAGLAAYLLSDACVPGARTWLRWPPISAGIGALSAWILFAQQSIWTPWKP